MGRPGPSDEIVTKAWELRVKGAGLARIAEELGIARSTAREYVDRGRELEQAQDWLDWRNERITGAAVMEAVRMVMFEAIDNGGDPVAAASVIIKAEERRSLLLGLDAPKRIALSADTPEPPTIDATTMAVIEAAEARSRRELGSGDDDQQG